MYNPNIPTHDGWNHRWGCPPISDEPLFDTCTKCNGNLRIRIKKDGAIEQYGNHTTDYGGIFCSTGCAISFINQQKKIEKNNKK